LVAYLNLYLNAYLDGFGRRYPEIFERIDGVVGEPQK
jgi:hypothetical protein